MKYADWYELRRGDSGFYNLSSRDKEALFASYLEKGCVECGSSRRLTEVSGRPFCVTCREAGIHSSHLLPKHKKGEPVAKKKVAKKKSAKKKIADKTSGLNIVEVAEIAMTVSEDFDFSRFFKMMPVLNTTAERLEAIRILHGRLIKNYEMEILRYYKNNRISLDKPRKEDVEKVMERGLIGIIYNSKMPANFKTQPDRKSNKITKSHSWKELKGNFDEL